MFLKIWVMFIKFKLNMQPQPISLYILLFCLSLLINTARAAETHTIKKIEITHGSQNERRKNNEANFYKPYSKQVISEKTIKEESIRDIAEAVRDIPGVSITENGSFSKNIKIRGLQGPRVSTLIDGIKLSNQGMTHTGAGETGMQDIANVKSIEVIKGSPAVLFDPGASGGVINIITHKAPLKQGLGLKQRFTYDEGYDLKKSTTIMDASNGVVGARLSYSKTLSEDYKIKGEDDKKLAISRSNALNSMAPNFLPINDLGYRSEFLSARVSSKIGSDSIVDFDWNNWTGKDMSLIHGPSIGDAIIIQYDRMDRNSHAISYRKDNLALLSDINIKYAKQTQFQAIGSSAIGVQQDTEQFNITSDLNFDNLMLKMGTEVIQDRAKTLIYSTQDYYGAFTNLEYIVADWTFFGGARFNQWQASQKLFSDTNISVAQNLIGISGITPPRTNSSPTFATGMQYAVNQNNNLSLNINSTYRNPTLLEKYAFGATLGGGINMQPEEGKHAEISWKYLGPKLSTSTSIFYSDFKNYIWIKNIRRIINQAALNACIASGQCNTAIGEYDNREDEFFQSYIKYYNSVKVTNWGMEFNAQYSIAQHEILIGASFNEIKSADIFVKSAAQPINSNISYRYEINNSWKPWVKIKAQYVIDTPKVEQHKGFDLYSLLSLHTGLKKNGFVVSAGVRNIMDKEYRAAYSGINGLARSFFINIDYDWNSRKP